MHRTKNARESARSRFRMKPGVILRRKVVRPLLTRLSAHPNYVLDVGGGSSTIGLDALPNNPLFAIVDIDDDSLTKAKDSGLAIVHADAAHMPFGDQTADIILALDLLTSLPEENETHVLTEICRVLQEDGFFVITHCSDTFGLPFVSEKEMLKRWNVRKGASEIQLERMLRLAGLTVRDKKQYFGYLTRFVQSLLFFMPWSGRLPKALKRLVWNIVSALDRWLPFGRQAFLWVAQVGHS